MKLALVSDTSNFNFDGVATYVNGLILAGDERDDEVLVLTAPPHAGRRRTLVPESVKVHEFDNLPIRFQERYRFGFPVGMRAILRGFSPDLVWIHSPGPLGLAAARVSSGEYATVFTKHCFDQDLILAHVNYALVAKRIIGKTIAKIESSIFDSSDAIVLHYFHCAPDNRYSQKILRTLPPLERKFFERQPQPLEHDGGKVRLGYCGRCDSEKGIDTIFRVLESLRRELGDLPVRFIFVGDGKLGRSLKRKHRELDVEITGFVDDVIPYLDSLDAFVLASKTETVSLSALEAYARNKPVITTPLGYLGGMQTPAKNVYVFRNEKELRDIIMKSFIEKSTPAVRGDGHARLIDFEELYSIVRRRLGIE